MQTDFEVSWTAGHFVECMIFVLFWFCVVIGIAVPSFIVKRSIKTSYETQSISII